MNRLHKAMDDRMNDSPKSPVIKLGQDLYSLIGNAVMKTVLPGKSDLSDWVDPMEVVEALCPKWPARPTKKYTEFRL